MTTRPSETSPSKRLVLIGSVWRRRDPSEKWVTFEVTHLGKNPHGQPTATGKTLGGKLIKVSQTQMENGDARFEHVHDDYVAQRAADTSIAGRKSA